ncbi:MAG: hypothetical protein K6F63_01770 [Lachnospiraceae bacterium]|nr:hypothetical protein [Lachnospiraceae bacterium]
MNSKSAEVLQLAIRFAACSFEGGECFLIVSIQVTACPPHSKSAEVLLCRIRKIAALLENKFSERLLFSYMQAVIELSEGGDYQRTVRVKNSIKKNNKREVVETNKKC